MRKDAKRNDIDWYGDKDKAIEKYEIGLVDEHYFIIEETNLTSYALENYHEIKDEPNCNKIFACLNGQCKTSNQRFIDSYKVIMILLENKDMLLEPMPYDDVILKSPYYDNVTNFHTLSFTDSNIKSNVFKSKDSNPRYVKYYKVFFDVETITQKKHEVYLACYETEDEDKQYFYTVWDMLLNLPDKPHLMLIAHNADYDARFCLKYLKNKRCVYNNNRFIIIDGYFLGKSIRIKCSYRLIDAPLSSFKDMFKLDREKEVMPYCIYTRLNIAAK